MTRVYPSILLLASLAASARSGAQGNSFAYGSVDGIVRDSVTRKPAPGLSVSISTSRQESSSRGNNVRADGHFDLESVPVADSASIAVHCALGEPMQMRILARSSIPVRPRFGTSVEILVDYSACFAPIAHTQRIHARGVFFSSGSILDSTFTPCPDEPLATALSVWSYPAWIRFSPTVHRAAGAPAPKDVFPHMYRALVEIAGTVTGPGVYGFPGTSSKHAPYEVTVDSILAEEPSFILKCTGTSRAPTLAPGTVSVLRFHPWTPVQPTPWMPAPHDSPRDVPPSSLPGHGNLNGALIDAGGHPVPGAHVSLTPVGPTATSDSTGRFLLRDVPFGDYRVYVARSGYLTDFTRNIVSGKGPGAVYITPRRDSTGLLALTDSARRARYPGATARARRGLGATLLGDAMRAADSTRRAAFDPLDPRVLSLLRDTKRCGLPAYIVDGYLTTTARQIASGEVRLGDLVEKADVDMVQLVASRRALDPRSRDDAVVLAALPRKSCRPVVIIWTRHAVMGSPRAAR